MKTLLLVASKWFQTFKNNLVSCICVVWTLGDYFNKLLFTFVCFSFKMSCVKFWPYIISRDGPRILSWGEGPEISKKKNSNMHPYSINKLSTKANNQKSLFLNILRYNHLLTKTKDTKHYCFFIQSFMKRELDALSNLQNHLRLNPN